MSRRWIICPNCNGAGCKKCDGSGSVYDRPSWVKSMILWAVIGIGILLFLALSPMLQITH